MFNIQLLAGAVVLLVARQVHRSAGGSMISLCFWSWLKPTVTGYQARYFAKMDQVSPIHSIFIIIRVKEMASILEQQKGNYLDQVNLVHLIDEREQCKLSR